MTTEFAALVDLIRNSQEKVCESGKLRLRTAVGQDTDYLINAVHTWVAPTVRVGPREHFGATADLLAGSCVDLEFRPVAGGDRGIFASLDEMLAFQGGRYQYSAPGEYYLVEEDYAKGETPPTVSDTASYQRVPELLQFLRSIEDVEVGSSPPIHVFLVEQRLDIPAVFRRADLAHLPSSTFFVDLFGEVTVPPNLDARKRIFKRVLRRFLETTPSVERLGQLMRSLPAVREAFNADYSLYESEFNFEKIRDEFERKRVGYMLKLNGAATDAMSKLLAIPVAQGLLVTQMRPGAWMANIALLSASIVFAVIAGIILKTQWHSAVGISEEIDAEKKNLEVRYPELYERLRSYQSLTKRADATKLAPWALAVLLLCLTVFTVACYIRVSHA